MPKSTNRTISLLLKIDQIRLFFIYILTPVLFCSYHPRLSLEHLFSDDTMNLELSLPLIWLVLFFLISLPVFIIDRKVFFNKKVTLAVIFLLYVAASIFWSHNPTRAILTTAILYLLFFATLSILHFFRTTTKNPQQIKVKILRIFFATSVFFCLIILIQCILDVFGADRSITLLCGGCTYQIFGFPHPNGFAIEPQYMGNLLLAPALLSLFLLFNRSTKAIKNKKILLFLSIFFIFSLFLTLSRGAIYALLCATAIFILAQVFYQRRFTTFLIIPILLFSATIAIASHGILANLSPTNDTFLSGVSTSVSQLSLGKINLKDFQRIEEQSSDQVAKQASPQKTPKSPKTPRFDGYVAGSTDIRLTLSSIYFKLWLRSFPSFFFGVGIGGAGVASHEAYMSGFYSIEFLESYTYARGALSTPKEIPQQEYIHILVELGVVGVLLLIIFLISIRKIFSQNRFFVILFVAYGVSLLFFSGLPNALHIYLFTPLLFSILPKHHPVIYQKI